MTIVMRPTCWHQNFGPNGLSAPAQGLCLNIFSSITADFNISSAIRWAIQDQWSSGFFFLSPIFIALSSGTVRNTKLKQSWNLVHAWTVGGCIMCIGIRLLLLIHPFISSFFFLSSFHHTFLRNWEGYKVETWYTCEQWMDVWCILESGCCSYSSLNFIIFLFLQFSNIKKFCRTFLRNYEDYKVKTWCTCWQWIDVSCKLESGCWCLFIPLFLHFSFSFIFKN